MNLLIETIEVLEENGKKFDDIVWVGTREVEIPIDVFKQLANKEYNCGYGAQEVAKDLIVCGAGWYMERNEYDGSEWWEFITTIERPKRIVRPLVIVDDSLMWATLKEANHPHGKYSNEPFDWEGMEVDNGNKINL